MVVTRILLLPSLNCKAPRTVVPRWRKLKCLLSDGRVTRECLENQALAEIKWTKVDARSRREQLFNPFSVNEIWAGHRPIQGVPHIGTSDYLVGSVEMDDLESPQKVTGPISANHALSYRLSVALHTTVPLNCAIWCGVVLYVRACV